MPEAKIRRKTNNNGWVIARKITQAIAFVVFFLAVVFSRQNGLPANLVDFTIRLSPLTMISHLLSSKTFLAGSALSLILLLSSLVFGRAWCGWLCPLGTILDLFRFSKNKNRKQPPENLRKLKYGLLIVILLSAIFGNLTLLFFDPLTIFVRATTLTILPVLDKIIFAVEKLLIKIPFLSDPVFAFDAWIRPAILPGCRGVHSICPPGRIILHRYHLIKPDRRAILVPLSLSAGSIIRASLQTGALSAAHESSLFRMRIVHKELPH